MSYIIPHSIIIKQLTDKTGIASRLPMKFLKAGHSKPNLEHVFSFRRTVEYDPDNTNMNLISDSIVINYKNEEFKVFLSTELNMQCFLCKKKGHPVKKCANRDKIEAQQKTYRNRL